MSSDMWIALANLVILILLCFIVWPAVKLYVTIFTSNMAMAVKVVLSVIIGLVMVAIGIYGISLLRALGLFKCG